MTARLRFDEVLLFPTPEDALNLQRTDVNDWLKMLSSDGRERETRALPAPAVSSGQPAGGH